MKVQQKRVCCINCNKLFLYLDYLLSLLHQSVHIFCNLLVSDLGIDLRAGNGRMPHHLSDALYRNASLQGQRAEAVSCHVVGQRSTNATRQAYYFKAGNQFALAHRIGEYLVILFAILLRVERKYLLRYRMQGNE